jgi:hypothetical protein
VNLCKTKLAIPRLNLFGVNDDDSYKEKQVVLKITANDIGRLISSKIIDGLLNVSFEQNYYYDLTYFKDSITRNLKIRRKSKIGGNKQLIESHLIYKKLISDDEYLIKSKVINDAEIADLLTNSLEGYRMSYVPAFAHIVESSRNHKLFMMVKRYSPKLRTFSIMGEKSAVDKFLQEVKGVIELKITPDPTYYRNVNSKLSLDFDYELLASEELELFKKYYGG